MLVLPIVHSLNPKSKVVQLKTCNSTKIRDLAKERAPLKFPGFDSYNKYIVQGVTFSDIQRVNAPNINLQIRSK